MKINLPDYPVMRSYDNQGAHDTLSQIMQRGERLNLSFGVDKENFPYVWVETKKVSGFKYRVNQSGLNWVSVYLTTGKNEDFQVNPTTIESLNEEEDKSFQLQILKQLVESGKQIQFTPLFRETSGYVSATANYKKGSIFFRIEKTEELIDYLTEKEQI